MLAIKSDVTLLIMFLKKSSEMFRRMSIISITLYAQKLFCNINNSKFRAKASRKPLKKSLENIFNKVTGRTKSRKQNTDENGIQENRRIKSVKSKFSGISLTNLFSKIAFGKSTSIQYQLANFTPSDSGISETLSRNGVFSSQESFHSVLFDKGFQCTSETARYLSELCEEGDTSILKFYLFEKGYYISDAEVESTELLMDKVKEDWDLKFQVPVSPKESLEECTSTKQPPEVNLIDKDFQCTSTTARYLSDLAEIDPSIIVMHGLYDDSLYNYDID